MIYMLYHLSKHTLINFHSISFASYLIMSPIDHGITFVYTVHNFFIYYEIKTYDITEGSKVFTNSLCT